jgi:hypothetical protein
MIDLLGYTCSLCGCDVDVQDTREPKIIWRCGHDGNVVHANLAGRLFGEGEIKHGVLGDEEIPAAHRERFFKDMADRAIHKKGRRLWWVSDWMEYIDGWHREQAAATAPAAS